MLLAVRALQCAHLSQLGQEELCTGSAQHSATWGLGEDRTAWDTTWVLTDACGVSSAV